MIKIQNIAAELSEIQQSTTQFQSPKATTLKSWFNSLDLFQLYVYSFYLLIYYFR